MGFLAIPVYEIYKVGADPHWLEGLDLMSVLGLKVVVIPHYDNAEGGTHDTRFCYLGERRLALLERELAADSAVLGVDEHTALVIDLATAQAEVAGQGRRDRAQGGRQHGAAGRSTISLADLRTLALSGQSGRAPLHRPMPAPPTLAPGPVSRSQAAGPAASCRS